MLAVSLPTLAELVHGSAPSKTSIAQGASLCQAVLREAGKNSTWRLPGNGVGDAKHTPGVGAGGISVRYVPA